jgi:hypothetical protein
MVGTGPFSQDIEVDGAQSLLDGKAHRFGEQPSPRHDYQCQSQSRQENRHLVKKLTCGV